MLAARNIAACRQHGAVVRPVRAALRRSRLRAADTGKETSSELELQLRLAVAAENYSRAAELKRELDAMAPPPGELELMQAALQKAVQDEQYQVSSSAAPSPFCLPPWCPGMLRGMRVRGMRGAPGWPPRLHITSRRGRPVASCMPGDACHGGRALVSYKSTTPAFHPPPARPSYPDPPPAAHRMPPASGTTLPPFTWLRGRRPQTAPSLRPLSRAVCPRRMACAWRWSGGGRGGSSARTAAEWSTCRLAPGPAAAASAPHTPSQRPTRPPPPPNTPAPCSTYVPSQSLPAASQYYFVYE